MQRVNNVAIVKSIDGGYTNVFVSIKHDDGDEETKRYVFNTLNDAMIIKAMARTIASFMPFVKGIDL